MIIFPAIDIKGGKCVRLLKGNFNKITYYDKSPVDQANEFVNLGFNNIYMHTFFTGYPTTTTKQNPLKNSFNSLLITLLVYRITGLSIQKTTRILAPVEKRTKFKVIKGWNKTSIIQKKSVQ